MSIKIALIIAAVLVLVVILIVYLAKPSALPAATGSGPKISGAGGKNVIQSFANALSAATKLLGDATGVSAVLAGTKVDVQNLTANLLNFGVNPSDLASVPEVVQVNGDLATAQDLVNQYITIQLNTPGCSLQDAIALRCGYVNSIMAVSSTSPPAQIKAAAARSSMAMTGIGDIMSISVKVAGDVQKLLDVVNRFIASKRDGILNPADSIVQLLSKGGANNVANAIGASQVAQTNTTLSSRLTADISTLTTQSQILQTSAVNAQLTGATLAASL